MEKLHPKVIWIFFFQFIVSGLFLLFFLGMFIFPFLASILFKETSNFNLKLSIFFLLPTIFYFAFCYIWAKLTYRFWTYDITEDAYKIEQGVIWKRYVSIPYERIQNIDIHRGILARILGLSELRIQTAGFGGQRGKWGAFSEGRLPGIEKQKAEQLREDLISRVKGTKQGL